MSSTVASFGTLTVFEIAPEMNGWVAPIILMWPMYWIERSPFAALNAQSNTGRCDSRNAGAPSMVSFLSM